MLAASPACRQAPGLSRGAMVCPVCIATALAANAPALAAAAAAAAGAKVASDAASRAAAAAPPRMQQKQQPGLTAGAARLRPTAPAPRGLKAAAPAQRSLESE
ncbi:hypothetical protein ABPG77_005761 [Micractinium sp. CCAP 211/92]